MPYLPANQAQYLLAWTHEACCQLVQVYGPFSHQLPHPSAPLVPSSQCSNSTHQLLQLCCSDTHAQTDPLPANPSLQSLELWAPSTCAFSVHVPAPWMLIPATSQSVVKLTVDQTHPHGNSLTA